MYIPSSNAETRQDVLLSFIEQNPFAILVTSAAGSLYATHIPFVLERSGGEIGVLEGHIARANPHHRQQDLSGEALVIFSGPHAYISPAWYPSKAQHGKAVPTWNYIAVHVYGRLRFTEDMAFLRRHLEQLTERHEGQREQPWSIRDAPPEYIGQLERAIIGVELEISRIEGKWKMSQNRPEEDIDGVIHGLSMSSDPRDRAVAEIVASRRP